MLRYHSDSISTPVPLNEVALIFPLELVSIKRTFCPKRYFKR